LEEPLIEKVESSDLLLAIISESYIKSEGCKREREAFAKKHLKRLDRKIIGILKEDLDIDDLPEEFPKDKQQLFLFYNDKGQEYEEDDKEFKSRIHALGKAIQIELESIRKGDPNSTMELICLPPPSDSLLKTWTSLWSHIDNSIPNRNNTRILVDDHDYEENLKSANVSIHLLDRNDITDSFQRKILDKALEEACKRELKIFVWISSVSDVIKNSGKDTNSESIQTLILSERIENEPIIRPLINTQGFEQFKSLLLHDIKEFLDWNE